ncbi:MAG: hypothetical protein HY738_22615 [Bacteroidia bacterium]|nr:hypothetical protein [Bacteroidia bacterium]
MDPNDPSVIEKSELKAPCLDVPIMFLYNFLHRKIISTYISAGAITSFLLSDKEITTMADGTVKKEKSGFLKGVYKQDATNILFAGEILFGASFNLTKSLFITIEPYFRYGINTIYSNALNAHPTSYGAVIGFNYRMK